MIESNNLSPGLSFYLTKETKISTGRRTRSTWRRSRTEDPKPRSPSLSPTIAVRARTDKDELKRRSGKGKIIEPYDFATNLLNIEVEYSVDADPFTDPQASPASHGVSTTSPKGPTTPTRARKSPVASPSRISSDAPPSAGPSTPNAHDTRCLSTPNQQKTPSERSSPRASDHSAAQQEQATPDSASTASSYFQVLENGSKPGTKFRAALLTHAQALFARQHRNFLFQVILVGHWARFIRWDRSGALVSARFDYTLKPQLLAEFIWRFSQMDAEQRGFDRTASLANGAESRQFKYAVKRFLNDMKAGPKKSKPVRRLPNAELTLDDSGTYPIWKIHVVDSATRKSTDLIVNRHFSYYPSMFGRATRAYIAYDMKTQRLVFLKDTWRAETHELRVESRTYQELKRRGVPHLPNVLYGGDVRNADRQPQATLTDVYADDDGDWRTTAGSFHRYIHHRIIQDIAYPIESALDARELIQAIHDIFCGETQTF